MKTLSAVLNRRRFLRLAGAGLAGFSLAPRLAPGAAGKLPPNQRINLGAIGVGGMGGADLNALAPYCNVIALCDVDAASAAGSFKKFSTAKRFRDYRRMFDVVGGELDAVLVATPDHFHATAALAALERGKHVYCEKPLAHSVHEIRRLMTAAREAGVVTQLGNQGHSYDSIRDFCEWIWAGAIGRVHTIHAGCRSINSALAELPRLAEHPPVPETLDWDTWLGPALVRPYHPAYLPKKWRSWVPFGNGTVGDWACHVLDPVFWALELGAPDTIQAEVRDYDPVKQGDSFPRGEIITYEFPGNRKRGPVTLKWYSGAERIPRPRELDPDEPDLDTGAVIIGDKGVIVHGSHGAGQVRLIPESRMLAFERPPKTLPRVKDHHSDWIRAIQNGGRAGSDFSYGGPLSELAMLGVIAIRLPGRKLRWQASQARFANSPEANELINPPRRAGWPL